MPVTAEDFLNSALSFDDCHNEMALRNRISRAYYGAYLLARDIQAGSGIKVPHVRGGVHAQLIEYYCKGLSPDTETSSQLEVAGLLQMAKALRTKADYKLKCLIPVSDGATALRCAKEVHKLLRACTKKIN